MREKFRMSSHSPLAPRSEKKSVPNHDAESLEKVRHHPRHLTTLSAYFLVTLATCIKTFAWWLNQFPFLSNWPFLGKWGISAAIAGFEYLPMTSGMHVAETNGMYFSLLMAYMEVMDSVIRMIQQQVLCILDNTRPPLGWYDWVTATGLVACVSLQAMMHYRRDEAARLIGKSPCEETSRVGESTVKTPSRELLTIALSLLAVVMLIGFLCGALLGGVLGQVYVLGSIATIAKTFAWWIGQYPFMKDRPFLAKWLAGWSVAGVLEYLPLVGAMIIGREHGVNLALLTAYMEAMDNWFRDLQMRSLGKPVYWYDATSNCGMALCVVFGGLMSYHHGREMNHR
jgi:hypothetical protein